MFTMKITNYALLFLFALTTYIANAQSSPCANHEIFGKLDFWAGEWEVFAPNGTKAGENEVRQFWRQSPDGGTTWTIAFDGKYVRKE